MLAARESKILSTRYAQDRRVGTWPLRVWSAMWLANGRGEGGGLRDWKLAVKRLGKSWYYALCMGLCNGTCSPTREPARSVVVRRVRGPIGNFTTRTWTCDPESRLPVAGLILAKAPHSGNFDLYILRARRLRRRSRYFPVVCRRVTFLIVIRHTHINAYAHA